MTVEATYTDVLRVGAQSHPNQVAGAIAAVIRRRETVEMQAVGAAAVNQAIKAVAIARSYLKADEYELSCIPGFLVVEINGERRTAITLQVRREAVTQA